MVSSSFDLVRLIASKMKWEKGESDPYGEPYYFSTMPAPNL